MKNLDVKIIIIIILFCFKGVCQIKENSCTIDALVIKMMQEESILEAKIMLDSLLKNKGTSVDKNFLAAYNYNYGIIFLSSGKFKESLSYLKKAQHITQELSNNLYASELPTVMLRIYREMDMYKQVDSLFHINVERNKKNKDRNIFFNYIDFVITHTNRKKYRSNIDVTQRALKEIDSFDFSTVEPNEVYSIRKIVRNELKLHLAMALIEEKEDYKRSYRVLSELEKDSLFFAKREREEFLWRVMSYKSRYFYEHQKQMDSVFYYQSLANNYREIYIKKLKSRAAQADEFIYDIAKNKHDLEQLSIINKKNVQLQKNYFYISFLIGFLLLLAIIFSVYVFRSNRHKNNINSKLEHKNKELLVVDEERNQFFSVISHELRTPIYTIQGLVEFIENAKNKKQRKEFIKTLKFSNNHLSGLVNNVLEYSKFRLGNIRLNNDVFCLGEMLKEICNSFSYQLQKNNTRLHIDMPKELETSVLGDRLKISQIFINLISNAIKFTSNGNIWLKVIPVITTEHTITFRFIVRDDGVGIKKELQADVFNGFNGMEHIDKHNGGSGLGLYIVKKVIEDLYKSSITLESEENKGTTFSFEIKMDRNLKDINLPKVKEEDYKNVLQGYTILVVDDNEINLMITKKILENAGAICIAIDNGIEAVVMVKENDYDIVFMDIHMPEQDGLQTTEKIREFDKDIIIMALTAVDLEKMVTKVYQSGMNGIITKPYKRSDLFQKILSFSLRNDEKKVY
ncbi:hybrid sensor histidine kinase/response regulator [Aquimarina longa]|uniref:hybrid sensor histidine kinase/response regulator n=1 Tax=Aquimarina longa TaxID=1080221 RepID=UPI00130DCD54|nr:response regulator [Aquimarina longa]